MQHSPDIPELCRAPCASAHSAKWDFEDEDETPQCRISGVGSRGCPIRCAQGSTRALAFTPARLPLLQPAIRYCDHLTERRTVP